MKAKILFIFALCALTPACAHAQKTPGATPSPAPTRVPGYGEFLFIPPGSVTIRNFLDQDEDGVDDRYQLKPGGPAYPVGHFYKK